MKTHAVFVTVVALFLFLASPAEAIVVADLKADYQNGTAEGQTSQQVGIAGTVTGLWNYYSDDDGDVTSGLELLQFANTVGGTASDGAPGYVGNNVVLPGLENFPAVSSGRVFRPDFVPPLASDMLQVHPGNPGQPGNDVLVIQYLATANLANVSLNYKLHGGTDANSRVDYQIFQEVGGALTSIVSTATLTTNMATGDLSVGVSNLSPGDSIWFVLDAGLSEESPLPFGDATNVGLEVVADPTGVMMLRVNRATGGVWLTGPEGNSYNIDGYSITSAAGQLVPGSWSPLQDNPTHGDGIPNNLSGWDVLGPGSSNQVGEFNGDGSLLFGDGGVGQVFLGNLFTPGGTEDLSLNISLEDGALVQGLVEYYTSTVLEGDYNNDGMVDAADYTVWRNNLGGTSLPNETASPGVVDHADYTAWKQNFGATANAALGVSSQAVPEPSALLLLSPLLLGVCCRSWFQRLHTSIAGLLAMITCLVMLPAAHAARTVDRLYQLGDEPTESATANSPVGAHTYDGVGSADEDWHDLATNGSPLYRSVATRPFAGPADLGVEFSGSGDFFLGTDGNGGLGSPASARVPNPSFDYSGITTRGIQLWARPTAAGTELRQDLVNDTYQFGLHITENDTWGMTWGAPAHTTNSYQFDSGVEVDFNEWTHLHQHSFGNQRGVLYVNGVAVIASDAGRVYQINEPAGASLDFTLGAGLAADGSLAFTGLLDEVEVYVAGSNAENDYGTFSIATDNQYISNYLSTNGYTAGDLTGDGVVSGDGSGGLGDDVAVFLANWHSRKEFDGFRVGDLETRLAGDFNFDGVVDLADWGTLRDNHVNGASLNLSQLLQGGHAVPEPNTLFLLLGLGCMAVARHASLTRRLVPVAASLCLIASLLSSGPQAQAIEIATESFDYAPGSQITDPLTDVLNGGTGWADSWKVNTRNSNPAPHNYSISEGSLTPVESFTPVSGNKIYLDGKNGVSNITDSVVRQLATNIDLTSSETYYFSFLVNKDTLTPGTTGASNLEFNLLASSLGNGWGNGIRVGSNSSNESNTGNRFYLQNASSVTAPADGYTFQNDTTYQVVLRLQGRDASAWMFRPGDEVPSVQSAPLLTTTLGASLERADYDTVRLWTGANTNGYFDEIRIGTTWEDVVLVPDTSPRLTIDRATGEMVLSNTTANDYQVVGYSIVSQSMGALAPSEWLSITDNYDANNDQSVDSDFTWFKLSEAGSNYDLSEAQSIVAGADGFTFGPSDSINLGNAWIANPTSDIVAELLIENEQGLSEVVAVNVRYTGPQIVAGDFNASGDITLDDWAILTTGFSSTLAGLSPAEKYARGDFNLDGVIDLQDARQFASAYDSLNGAGALALALSSNVPEPGAVVLVSLALAGGVLLRRRCVHK